MVRNSITVVSTFLIQRRFWRSFDILIQQVGAGYTGLTTAAELSLRGFRVNVVAQDLGYRPPLTIVGTQVASSFTMVLLLLSCLQSRRWPGSAVSNQTFDHDDLLDKELQTISRFLALSSKQEDTGVAIIPALKVSRKANNTWNKRPLDDERLKVMMSLCPPH